MSERSPRCRTKRLPRDVLSGCMLLVLSVFVFWNTQSLSAFSGFTFGAGTAPRLAAFLLGVVGVVIAVNGICRAQEEVAPCSLRGVGGILAATVFFAVAINLAGFALTVFGTALIASIASSDWRWRESIFVAALAAALCSALFVQLLKLPVPLWPEW